MTEDLRYPLGKFEWVPPENEQQMGKRREHYIDVVAKLPENFATALKGLSPEQLDTPYRPGGWTVRQLAHHIPDSHINSYVRYRLALTEDTPVIKPYEEQLWAELADARSMPIAPSLDLLESLHERWVPLLRSLSP